MHLHVVLEIDIIADYIVENLRTKMPEGLQQMRRDTVPRFLHNDIDGAVIT